MELFFARLSICGGIGSAPVNPHDRSDEGIFIERVERDGPACSVAGGAIAVGTRILEVGDESLLGCTKEEAAQIFRRAPLGPVKLLICKGFGVDKQHLKSVTVSSGSPQQPPTTTKRVQSEQNTRTPPQETTPTTTMAGIGLPLMLGVQSPIEHNNSIEPAEQYQNLGNRTQSPNRQETKAISTAVEASGSVPLLAGSPTIREVTTFSSKPSPEQKKNGGNNKNAEEQFSGKKIPPPIAPKPKTKVVK